MNDNKSFCTTENNFLFPGIMHLTQQITVLQTSAGVTYLWVIVVELSIIIRLVVSHYE